MKRIEVFDILKFFGIIYVMCAHLSPVAIQDGINIKFSILFDSIGALGVPIFFLIAGYFFKNNKKNIKDFFRNKIKTIYIPWIFIGTIVYISVFYFQHSLSAFNYLKFIMGYGSYLYFLTVLNILYLIYFKLKDYKLFLHFTSFISVVSIFLTCYFGLNTFSYINVFNWIIYFNLGIYINKYKLLEKIEAFCVKYLFGFVLLLILSFGIHLYKNISIGYWTIDGFIIILVNMCFLLGINKKINITWNFAKYIGKNSLSFYLIHMPIAGVIVRVTNILTPLIIFRPFLSLIITFIVVKIYDIITNSKSLTKFKFLIGVR